MNKPAKWGLIGYGNIGHEIIRQVSQAGVAQRLGLEVKPQFIAEHDGLKGPDGQAPLPYKQISDLPELPDVTFVAIPSSDSGQVSYDYIVPLLKAGKLVITAEKGALANNFAELRDLSDNFQ